MFGIIDWLIDHAGEESIFDSIKKDNKSASLFIAPPNRKQILINAGVVDRIFKEFKFRTLSKTSSKNQIYKSIVNTAFKANIICSSYNEELHVSYKINEDLAEWLEPVYQLCTKYKKVVEKIPMLVVEEEQIECLDYDNTDY